MRPASTPIKFGFLIHDVSRMRRTLFDHALKPLAITRAQWWALGNLSRHADEGMIQTELANILETGKVNAGGLIDRLEESGLIYRQADKHDRRVKRIFITDKGYDILDHIQVVGDQLDKIVFEDISDADLDRVVDVLTRVKTNVRNALKAPPIADPLPPALKRGKAAGKVRRKGGALSTNGA